MTSANYISIAALLVSLVMMIVNVRNISRNQTRAQEDDEREKEQIIKRETEQQTGIMLALNSIKEQLQRIETEINTVRQDTRENHDKIIIIEQSQKSEHKRLDNLAQRIERLEKETREAGG